MLIHIQRVTTTLAVALWFGGFTFYTACVVRVGSKIVGGLPQGYVTQKVTAVLEILAAIMTATVLADLSMNWKRSGKWTRILQCAACLVMAGSTLGTTLIHHKMNALINSNTIAKPNHELFSPLHQAYQFISTCLWIATVIYIVLMTRVYHTKTPAVPSPRQTPIGPLSQLPE